MTKANTGKFEVVNMQTGAVVATCSSFRGAHRSADRRDNKYGAYIHKVRRTA